MERIYEEKLIEDFVKDFPQDFLGEDLELFLQQPTLSGFRPDLIFKDSNNRYVIVEIQLNALDRSHFYRGLEYRDLFAEEYKCKTPRVILLANELPERYLTLANIHSVECHSITKKEFIKLACSLKPSLKIIEKNNNIISEITFTLNKLLKSLNTNDEAEASCYAEEATIMVFPCSFPYRYSHPDEIKYRIFPLPEVKNDLLYVDQDIDIGEHIDLGHKIDSMGALPIDHLPVEVILKNSGIYNLNIEDINRLQNWIEIITQYHISKNTDQVYVLGYRGNDAIYGYEQHIKDRIRKFQPLWRTYGRKIGYDTELLKMDLEKLSKIVFLLGKHPCFYQSALCNSIDITSGSGPLSENIKRRREIIEYWSKNGVHNYTAEEIDKFDQFIKDDEKEWITIKLNAINREIAFSIKELFILISNNHYQTKKKEVKHLLTGLGIIPPLSLKNATSDRLELSSKYLRHLGGQCDVNKALHHMKKLI